MEPLHFPVTTPPAPGETLAIAPGVRWLRMKLPFALNHINLWLLEDGPGWTIVDCGYALDETRESWERIFADARPGRRRRLRGRAARVRPARRARRGRQHRLRRAPGQLPPRRAVGAGG